MTPEHFTALVVPLPKAEEAVARWEAQQMRHLHRTIAAHVTVLMPFVPEPAEDDLARLGTICARMVPFDVILGKTAWFRESPQLVLWLVPEPSEPFAELTAAVASAWPEFPPYGGIHGDPVPHVTVAVLEDVAALEQIESDLTGTLPVHDQAAHLVLLDVEPRNVRELTRWRFGEPA